MALKQKLKNYPGIYNVILSVLNVTHYFTFRFAVLFPKKAGLRPGPGQISPNNRALVLVQYLRSMPDAKGLDIRVFTVHEFRLLR